MSVLRWDPWGDLAVLQRDVQQLMDRGPQSNRSRLAPPIDAHRTDDGMVVRMEVPGIPPDKVEVSVHDGVLTVSGEREATSDVSDDAWIRRERVWGAFERTFTLPDGTNPDDIKADYQHGVLELTIPHPPERKPRKITVGGGSESETVDVEERQQS